MKICDVTFQKDRRQYSREGKSTTLIGRVRECVASRPKRERMGKQRPERRECDTVGCCGGWTDRRDDVRISRILYIMSTLALDLHRSKVTAWPLRTPLRVYSDGGLVSCHDSATKPPEQLVEV